MQKTNSKKIIVGITGASGIIYAIRFLQHLQKFPVEIHLVLTKAAQITRHHESNLSLNDFKEFGHYHPIEDIGASIASGSFQHDGMVILPCSMHTLAEIAHGFSSNLLTRAADVCLKEKRTLIIMPRETPLHQIHIQNMLTVSQAGGIIYPPMPAFYHHPQSIEEMIDHSLGRIFNLLGFDQALCPEWSGWR